MERIPKSIEPLTEVVKDADFYTGLFLGSVCLVLGLLMVGLYIDLEGNGNQSLIEQYHTLRKYNFLDQVPLKDWVENNHEGRLWLIDVTTEAK